MGGHHSFSLPRAARPHTRHLIFKPHPPPPPRCSSIPRAPPTPRAQRTARHRTPVRLPRAPAKLANPEEPAVEEPAEERNRWVVRELYEALNAHDVDTVHRLLAPDLEWWFHGPPSFQHMMHLLTGRAAVPAFPFRPSSISAFGPVVIAEGAVPGGRGFWVHAWTVGSDGVVTRVREYFNTSLTVTRLSEGERSSEDTSSSSSSRSSPTTGGGEGGRRRCLWQSSFSCEVLGRSVPGLVLAL